MGWSSGFFNLSKHTLDDVPDSTTYIKGNWNDAFGWGDHAVAGYFIKATDDLDCISDGTTYKKSHNDLTDAMKSDYDAAHTHVSNDGSDHSKVTANETAIALNTTHRGSDGSDHSKVTANETATALNTTHRGSDGTDHTYIDQDLQQASSPTFAGATLSGLSTAGIVKNNASGVLSDEGKITDLADVRSTNLTYYVRTDGDDGNDGSANDAAHAFLTIQKAFNMIRLYKKVLGYYTTITVNVDDGTYSVNGIVGSLVNVEVLDSNYNTGIRIIGNSTNPENVIIRNTSDSDNMSCFNVGISGYVFIQGFQFECSGSGNTNRHLQFQGCNLRAWIRDCKFNHSGAGADSIDILAQAPGAVIYSYNNSTNGAASTTNLRAIFGAIVIKSGTQSDGNESGRVMPYLSFEMDSLTNGDMWYINSGRVQRLAKGSDNDLLTLSGGIPAWTGSLTGLNVNGDTATVRISDSSGSRNPRLELLRGTGAFGSDGYADWRIHNILGNLIFRVEGTAGSTLNDDAMTILHTGVVKIKTQLDVDGVIRGQKEIQTKTGNHNVLSTESNCVFVGKTNAVIFTLPSAVAGLTYTFIVGTDGQRVTITAAAGDTIDGSAAAGNTWADAIKETITIVAIDSTSWIITSKLGTWTTI